MSLEQAWKMKDFSTMKIKLHGMKTVDELNNSKMPVVAIDTSLNKYRDKTLFPQNLALANKQLTGVKLPEKIQRS